MCPDSAWMNSFPGFVFGIITISTARVDYVFHKQNTVQSANVN